MKNQEFNSYMNKFKNQYFIKTDEDNIRIIEGTLGKIAPYSPEKQLLGIWCTNLTVNMKKTILRSLNAILIDVHQDGDCEFGAYFHEKHLDIVCKVIKARKKRQLTNEERQALVARAKVNFNLWKL